MSANFTHSLRAPISGVILHVGYEDRSNRFGRLHAHFAKLPHFQPHRSTSLRKVIRSGLECPRSLVDGKLNIMASYMPLMHEAEPLSRVTCTVAPFLGLMWGYA